MKKKSDLLSATTQSANDERIKRGRNMLRDLRLFYANQRTRSDGPLDHGQGLYIAISPDGNSRLYWLDPSNPEEPPPAMVLYAGDANVKLTINLIDARWHIEYDNVSYRHILAPLIAQLGGEKVDFRALMDIRSPIASALTMLAYFDTL
ncbi:MAG: hypothetical protein Q7R83_04285 [bacterium]|nr:hypothetical protein [bacterium]